MEPSDLWVPILSQHWYTLNLYSDHEHCSSSQVDPVRLELQTLIHAASALSCQAILGRTVSKNRPADSLHGQAGETVKKRSCPFCLSLLNDSCIIRFLLLGLR